MCGALSRAQLASGIIIGGIFVSNELIGMAEPLNKHLYGFICRMQISKPTES